MRNKMKLVVILLCSLAFLLLSTFFVLLNVDYIDSESIEWDETGAVEAVRIVSDGKLQIRIHQETTDCYRAGESLVLHYSIKNISDQVQYISSNDTISYAENGNMTPYFYNVVLDYLFTPNDLIESFQKPFEGQNYIPIEPYEQVDRKIEIIIPSEVLPRTKFGNRFNNLKPGIYFIKIYYVDYSNEGYWNGSISSNLSAFCFLGE